LVVGLGPAQELGLVLEPALGLVLEPALHTQLPSQLIMLPLLTNK